MGLQLKAPDKILAPSVADLLHKDFFQEEASVGPISGSTPSSSLSSPPPASVTLTAETRDINSFAASCPAPAHCYCRDLMLQLLQTKVYRDCPRNNAFFDPWHRAVTGFMGCYTDEAEVVDGNANSTLLLKVMRTDTTEKAKLQAAVLSEAQAGAAR